MNIILSGTGKKFNTEWIFRKLSCRFEENKSYAILGRNGSGKSTLLQVIAGSIHPTAGTIKYYSGESEISSEKIFQQLTLVAPYQELIEEFTLEEMLKFHFAFKSPVKGITIPLILERIGFKNPGHKVIRLFSSGMKQRVKLVLAIMSDLPLLLLDEPTMNLDKAGIDWYLELIRRYTQNRTVIICSNLHQQESAFATSSLQIEDFK